MNKYHTQKVTQARHDYYMSHAIGDGIYGLREKKQIAPNADSFLPAARVNSRFSEARDLVLPAEYEIIL